MNTMNQKISYVIPCYRSEKTLPGVIAEIRETMVSLTQYSYEIILVNDCSPDGTFEVIRSLAQEYDNVIGINLVRNFGQHAALMAGLRQTTGDIVVCLDDDGQTPACEVGKLLAQIEAGDDVVYAKYAHKQHSWFRNLGSKVNDEMTRIMLEKPKDLFVSSYFAVRRIIVDEMIKYQNSYPYVIGLVLRSTKKISNVEVHHREREIGTSGYTLKKLFALWMNGFTAFSIKPLRIATAMGISFAGVGFLYAIYTVIKKCVNPDVPVGFSALITAIVVMGGMIMVMLGLIGEYVGRMYISMNDSPQYIVREVVGQQAEVPCVSEIVGSDKQDS